MVASAVAVTGIGAIAAGPSLPLAAASTDSSWTATSHAGQATSPYGDSGIAHRGALAEVSRSAARHPADDDPAAVTVQQAAARRDRALRGVVDHARSYAALLDQRHWMPPTTHFHITEWFGEPGWMWSTGYHTGVDFATSCYTPAVAVTDATVARSGWDGPYGNQVRIRIENGDQIWYNHLSVISAHAGEALQRGQQVGLIGETGNAYGCHLHLEYRRAAHLKQPVDPVPYLAQHGIHLR